MGRKSCRRLQHWATTVDVVHPGCALGRSRVCQLFDRAGVYLLQISLKGHGGSLRYPFRVRLRGSATVDHGSLALDDYPAWAHPKFGNWPNDRWSLGSRLGLDSCKEVGSFDAAAAGLHGRVVFT